uniref:Uncharacterized protein n=1 Tax=Oryza meridionalis TaxID=40149 RepID=A0A0E0C2S8_9ORYZ
KKGKASTPCGLRRCARARQRACQSPRPLGGRPFPRISPTAPPASISIPRRGAAPPSLLLPPHPSSLSLKKIGVQLNPHAPR